MKALIKILSLACMALCLFACEDKKKEAKKETPSASKKVSKKPKNSAPIEAKAEDSKENKKVQIDPSLLEAMSEPRNSKNFCMDASSPETARESMREMQKVIRELPREEQQRARSAMRRIAYETMKDSPRPNMQDFRNMSDTERSEARKGFEESMFKSAQTMNGKTLDEIMAYAESLPAVSEEEMREVMPQPPRRGGGRGPRGGDE